MDKRKGRMSEGRLEACVWGGQGGVNENRGKRVTPKPRGSGSMGGFRAEEGHGPRSMEGYVCED